MSLSVLRLLPFPLVLSVALVTAGPASAVFDEGDGARAARPVEQSDVLSLGERAVRIALTMVGTPYRYGGESPATGFDCSGLVRWAYEHVGVDLPHNSYALFGEGRRVARGEMKPGDVLFFEGLGHVGLFLGDGRMVHAPQTGRNVEVVRLAASSYSRRLIGARRMTPA